MNKNLLGHVMKIGPAIVIASVVLGPGSILLNSKVGWTFGYSQVWLLVTACVLMLGMTALSARLGVFLEFTPCTEIANRIGRGLAILIGVGLFLIAASFQISNNVGVLFAIEPFVPPPAEGEFSRWPIVVLLALNSLVILSLFFSRNLYRTVESWMKILVAVMIVGFAANLIMAKPSIVRVLGGLVPDLSAFRSTVGQSEKPADNLLFLAGLIATTFSVAAAFYQAYLVKQRHWTRDDLVTGFWDSLIGIGTLCLMSMMVMVTAAAAFHGKDDIVLNTAADVAIQLRPLFGPFSTGLFCIGIFAGALSSFLVNAMIGGTVLSDGFGTGSDIDGWGPRLGTLAALLIGMFVAIAAKAYQFNTGSLIVFAQAITVIGNPLMAAALIWLATRPELRRQRAIPKWMFALSILGFFVVLGLSVRTVILIS